MTYVATLSFDSDIDRCHSCDVCHTLHHTHVSARCVPLSRGFPQGSQRKNLAGRLLKTSIPWGTVPKISLRRRQMLVEVRRGAGMCDDSCILERVLDSAFMHARVSLSCSNTLVSILCININHTHTYKHAHTHIHTHTHTCTHTHTHAHEHTHTHTHTRPHINSHLHERTHAHTHAHTRTHTHTLAHTRTHNRIHTQTHTWFLLIDAPLFFAHPPTY